MLLVKIGSKSDIHDTVLQSLVSKTIVSFFTCLRESQPSSCDTDMMHTRVS